VDNPSRWPDPPTSTASAKPVIDCKILTNENMWADLKLVEEKRGSNWNFEYVTSSRVLLTTSCR